MTSRIVVRISLLLVVFLLLATPQRCAAVSVCQQMLADADSLRRAAQYDAATDLARRALTIAERDFGPADTSVARGLHILGDCNRRQGNYDEAESYLIRALDIREKALGVMHPDVAKCLNSLALLRENQGSYNEADSLHQRALHIREAALGPDHPDVAQTLNNLGSLCAHRGRNQDAELYYRRALGINEAALGSEHPTVALGLNNIALLCESEGRYAEAERLHRRALAIREKVLGPDHPDVAQSLINLAVLDEDFGRYADAEPQFKRALNISERALGKDHPDVAACLNNLASLYTHEGRFSDAEQLFKRALKICEKTLGSDHPELALILNNLAMVCEHQEHFTDSEALYRRAIKIREKALGPEDPDLAMSINNLAILYWNEGRYNDAEPLHRRALDIWEKSLGADHPDVANALNDLGTLYQDQNHYAEAEPILKRAMAIREKSLGSGHPDVAESLSSLSVNRMQQGGYIEAAQLESRAWTIRRLNFRDGAAVLAERNALEYSQFLDRESAIYLSILLDAPNGRTINRNRIAEVVFSSKGQVTDGMLARNQTLVQETDSTATGLADSLRRARFALSKLYVDGPGDDSITVYRNRLTEAERVKERLEAELARHSASFAKDEELWNVSVPKIAESLPARASLLEFMRYDHRLNSRDSEPRYIAVVLRSGREAALYELGKATEIDSAVMYYRRHFHDPANLNDQDYASVSDGIYNLCWKPFASLLDSSSVVFIAPDGDLSQVSFAGLKDEQGHYLIEDYPLHYVSTGRDLIRLQERPSVGSGLLAMGDPDYGRSNQSKASARGTVGDLGLSIFNLRSSCDELNKLNVPPLPGTRKEVEAVAAQWRASRAEPVFTYLGSEATEANFKQAAPGKRVIHLATHGFNILAECQPRLNGRAQAGALEDEVGENPMLRCGFLLSGVNRHAEEVHTDKEDGIVTAEEVAGLSLQGTDLVVLSACETGLGVVRAVEGVYGIRRAFQMAGARTVISTLWSVDDKATAALMGQLFSTQQESIPEAMRQAALRQIHEARSEGKSDHPFYWAAFVATGDWKLH